MGITRHTYRHRAEHRPANTVSRATFIRVTSNTQIEVVEAMASEIWKEHYTPIIGGEQVDYMLGRFQSKKSISAQIKKGVLYFLIEAGSKIIGYIAVQSRGPELFLSKIYVRSSKRTRGYGREAVLFTEDLARKRGLGVVSLTVNKNNITSLRFYEKLEFRNLGSVVQDIGGGFVMDDYRMVKYVSRFCAEREQTCERMNAGPVGTMRGKWKSG